MQGDWVFWATALAAGATVGSFLNVVIYRGETLWGCRPEGASRRRGDLIAPGSYCPSCQTRIAWPDLAPIISYIALRGRCRQCGAPIGLSYLTVEVLGGLAALASLAAFGFRTEALLAVIAVYFLMAIEELDRRTTYIPDQLSLPFAAIGLAANAAGLFTGFVDAAIGAGAGFLSLWGLGALYKLGRGREGLGGGDAVLLAGIGAWVGWRPLPFVVFMASFLTLGAVAAMRLRGRPLDAQSTIPFGPGLAVAGAGALFFKSENVALLARALIGP